MDHREQLIDDVRRHVLGMARDRAVRKGDPEKLKEEIQLRFAREMAEATLLAKEVARLNDKLSRMHGDLNKKAARMAHGTGYEARVCLVSSVDPSRAFEVEVYPSSQSLGNEVRRQAKLVAAELGVQHLLELGK